MKHGQDILYLNNSATSFPKPPAVAEAMHEALTKLPQMTGRGEEASTQDRVQAARIALCRFLGGLEPERLIFTLNSTDALNMAIHGLFDAWADGRPLHAVTTSNDHNSVLRPLRTLEAEGRARVSIAPMSANGVFDLDAIIDAVEPQTRLVAVNHISNVLGTVAPLKELGEFCRSNDILFLVDASQSAGLLPIDISGMQVDLMAITGHKYMFGPTGIGALYIGERARLLPRKQGGTGVRSADPLQPEQWPIRYEAGTVNYVGIVGLDAGRSFIEQTGPSRILERSAGLRKQAELLLRGMDGVTVYGPGVDSSEGSVVTFRLAQTGVAEADEVLRNHFGIIVRSGLHCAPLLHERMGTAPEGALRASFSYLTPEDAPQRLADAVAQLLAS